MPPNSFPTPMMNPGENKDDANSEASTKEKESTSAEGEQLHYRLDEIKRCMYERKVKKFDKVLSQKVIDLD